MIFLPGLTEANPWTGVKRMRPSGGYYRGGMNKSSVMNGPHLVEILFPGVCLGDPIDYHLMVYWSYEFRVNGFLF